MLCVRNMASTFVYGFLVFSLALQPMIATPIGNILAPILSPVIDDLCKEVECGKGTCKASANTSFFFECVCHPGWKQTLSGHDDDVKFLPCVIPNCTLKHSCTEAPAPVQEKSIKPNDSSIFDPCYWSHCGDGSCNKTSKYGYNCECSEGYSNLLNVSSFPCFKECQIGMDCANLGITLSNKSSSTPETAGNSKNQGSSTVRFSLWSVTMMVFMSLISW